MCCVCPGAVVFGIIIDTFGELRGQTKDKQNDMNGTCFICGISREEFDREAAGFGDHIEHDHNVCGASMFLGRNGASQHRVVGCCRCSGGCVARLLSFVCPR